MTLEELAPLLTRHTPIAGLDLGTKTIGLAVGTLGTAMAFPRPVLKRKKFTLDAQALIAFMAEEKVAAAIIGLPLNMNGSEGPRCQATRAFVRNMEQLTETPFIYWDERLSTVAAERSLLEMDVSRAGRKERIDSAAASFILQGALSRLSQLASSNSAK